MTICELTSHLQRKEGDGYMQQIIKLNFGCNYINQNARPLETIQHKKQDKSYHKQNENLIVIINALIRCCHLRIMSITMVTRLKIKTKQ